MQRDPCRCFLGSTQVIGSRWMGSGRMTGLRPGRRAKHPESDSRCLSTATAVCGQIQRDGVIGMLSRHLCHEEGCVVWVMSEPRPDRLQRGGGGRAFKAHLGIAGWVLRGKQGHTYILLNVCNYDAATLFKACHWGICNFLVEMSG